MLKKSLLGMTHMCKESWCLFMGTLKLSCVMLFCAFLLLIGPERTYDHIKLAASLAETPQGLLLIAILSSALIDERRG